MGRKRILYINKEILEQVGEWREQCGRLRPKTREFDEWFFERIAPVLFARKTGTLIFLRSTRFRISLNQSVRRIVALSKIFGYSYKALIKTDNQLKIIIYNLNEARKALSNFPDWAFAKLGYEAGIAPEQLIRQIARKWRQQDEFPHELALFLGYPTKDIIGFMKLATLKKTDTCGWQVYANPEYSRLLQKRYKRAKKLARLLMDK